MTRDELHYLADHVNDEMFDRIRAIREQVKVLSEEKIHSDRRINNQRKELKRKDERINGLREIIEDILGGAENATVAPEPCDEPAISTLHKFATAEFPQIETITTSGSLPTDPRDEALRVAEGALEAAYEVFGVYAMHHLNKGDVVKYAKNDSMADRMGAALAAIRGRDE